MPRKRAPNGSGVIRQRKDGRWEAIYSVGNDPGTGKLLRKSIYGKTSDEVAKKLRKATTVVDDGLFAEPEKLTVGQWLDLWIKEYTGDLKPRTLEQYSMHVRLNLKPNMGAVKLQALGTNTIQSTYNKLQRRAKPLSAKSIRNLHGVLHSCLEKAVELGYIKFNPSNACTLPRVVKKEMSVLKEDEVGAFLTAIKGHRHEYIYLIDLFTGMREGEILGLTWDRVNLKKGTVLIAKQLQKEVGKGGKFRLVPLKNDKERLITPAPFIMQLLTEQKRKQAEWKLRAGSMWDNNMNLVFTNELGRYLNPTMVYRGLKQIVERMGLSSIRFHDLRHSYAMMSLKNGDDPKTVQENLGHATASFTLDQYGHSSEQMKRTSAAKMEDEYHRYRQDK